MNRWRTSGWRTWWMPPAPRDEPHAFRHGMFDSVFFGSLAVNQPSFQGLLPKPVAGHSDVEPNNPARSRLGRRSHPTSEKTR
jgi:hypothetical protein